MTAVLYRVRNLVKDYGIGDLRTQVLKNISLDIGVGEFIAMSGPSGSGKSTLLTILGTLLSPTFGELDMLGQNLSALDEAGLSNFRSAHVGFVFPFHHLLPDFSAEENVAFPAAALSQYNSKAIRDRAAALLERVGLSDRRTFRPSALSGGQKQRVAIARSLMNHPELILADEPTGNLDRASASQVLELMREINRTERTTFVISTHDAQVASYCDRTITVVDGTVS